MSSICTAQQMKGEKTMLDIQSIFLKEKSFACYSDAAVLDLLFTTAGVRGDNERIIESLFNAFGSFKNILEARPEQLMNVPGITKKVATLVAMITPLARLWERTCMPDPQAIRNRRDAEAFCRSLMLGERTEHFFAICLNARCQLNGYRLISEGSLSEVSAYPRSVVEAALNYNAHSLILAHNHPGGTCAPSAEDISSTLQLQRALNTIGVHVLDHIIVAGADCYSMAQHGDVEFR